MRLLLIIWLFSCRAAAVDRGENAASSAALAAPDCASQFGDALPPGFGRLDGTLVAVVQPSDPYCAMPNPDHVVLQVRAGGKVYRVLVNTKADRGPSEQVRMTAILSSTLEGPAFAEGWHAETKLDYSDTLGALPQQFRAVIPDEVSYWFEIGEPISIYGSSDRGHSVHLIHRTDNGRDGALVYDPKSDAPIYLLFAFEGQAF